MMKAPTNEFIQFFTSLKEELNLIWLLRSESSITLKINRWTGYNQETKFFEDEISFGYKDCDRFWNN